MYVHSTLHKKTEIRENVKCGSVVLAFHYCSCFNASLWRYAWWIYFAFKRSKPVLITLSKGLRGPVYVSIKS